MRARSQSVRQSEVDRRLRFEMLLADVCAQFVNAAPDEVDSKVENAQRLICESLGVNRSSVWQLSEHEPDVLVMTHTYRGPKVKPLPTRPILKEHFPWCQNKILNKQIVCVPNTAKLPSKAARDMASWRRYGIRSALAFPLSVGGGRVIGLLTFDSTEERDWPKSMRRRLHVLALVFAQALNLKNSMQKVRRAEEALRASEERLRLAAQTGKMYAFEWDVTTDAVVRSPEYAGIIGQADPGPPTHQQFLNGLHPDDRKTFLAAVASLTPENPTRDVTYRYLPPSGGVVWLKSIGHGFFDSEGKMRRIVGMVADVTDHKLAVEKLREYEKTVEGLEEMIAVVDRDYRYLIANRKFLNMRNMSKEQVEGHSATEVLNQGVFESVLKEKLDECFQGKVVRFEMKYTYPALGERDVLVSYFPIEGASGIDRVACIVQDITERKLAEEALSGTTRKLIEAQEKERARIARDLHDDVAQRVALLCVGLDRLQQALQDSEVSPRIGELRRQTDEILADLQSLSHELHSSKLEHLGMAAAMRNLCKEFGEQQKMEISFQSNDLPCPPPLEVSVSLFRVLQEALRNAAKHSGVKYVEVRLRGTTDDVHLMVGDSGSGFEVRTAIQGRGLGLTSMQERIRLVNGTILIDSKPMAGTRIHIRVPFPPMDA